MMGWLLTVQSTVQGEGLRVTALSQPRFGVGTRIRKLLRRKQNPMAGIINMVAQAATAHSLET